MNLAKMIACILLLVCPFTTFSQTTVTIDNTTSYGSAPTFANGVAYKNFYDAVTKLNAASFSSSDFPIVVNVTAGQTFTEASLIPAITQTGTSGHTITFQRLGSGSNPLIHPANGTGSTDFVIGISGADYITFDGIDVQNGSSTSTNTKMEYGYYIVNSGSNGAQHNTIKNCTITLDRTDVTSIGLYQKNTTDAGSTTTIPNSSNLYSNVTVKNSYSGIIINGFNNSNPTVANDINNVIQNCIIGDSATTDDIGCATAVSSAPTVYGIQTNNQSRVSINNCEIRNVTFNSSSGGGFVYGVNLNNNYDTSYFYNNKIHDVTNRRNNGSGNAAYGLLSTGTSSSLTNIYNNFVARIVNTSTSSANAVLTVGISVTGSGTTNIYFNSIYAYFTSTNTVSNSALIYVPTSTSVTLNVLNNILKDSAKSTSMNTYCFYLGSGTLNSSDYNIFDCPASGKYMTGYNGSNRQTLANWQSGTSKDANSKQFTALFNSIVDLHLNLSSSDSRYLGTSISSPAITTDIDGNSRCSTPTIGADEMLSATSIGGTLSANSISLCLGSSIDTFTLSGNTGTIIKWQKKLNNGSYNDISDTIATLIDTLSSAGTWTYKVVIQNGSCASYAYSSTVSVSIFSHSVGGSISGISGICLGTTDTLTLNNDTGSIIKWQKQYNGGAYVDITNTTNQYVATPDSVGTWNYRAIVQSGVCSTVYSSVKSIVVYAPSVGGTVSGGTTSLICLGSSTGTMTVSGYTGSIIAWQRQLYDSGYITIPDTTNTYEEAPGSAGTWTYRAIIQSGPCSIAYSASDTIRMNTPAVGGIIIASKTHACFGDSTGTFKLVDYTGSIIKWQKQFNGEGYVDISSTDSLYNEIPDSIGVWDYRVLVQNDSCEAYSNTLTYLVDSASVCTGDSSVVDTTIITQINHVFEHLETNRVPKGILLDKGIEFTDLTQYNGRIIADSSKTIPGTVMDIYGTIAMSFIDSSAGTFNHPIYVDSVWQIMRKVGVITLGGIYFQYSKFKSSAVDSNLISIVDSQVYDKYVGGVWQNPYEIDSVFAVSPSINFYNSQGTYQLQAILPSSLWLTNDSLAVDSVSADFDDGNGDKKITFGDTVNLNYSSGGLKTWVFTLHIGSNTLQSRTDIQLDSASMFTSIKLRGFNKSLCSMLTKRDLTYNVPPPDDPRRVAYPDLPLFKADQSFYNQNATGYVTIEYSNGNTHHIFQNPFIVVEGFDYGDVIAPELRYGLGTIDGFLGDVTNSGTLQRLLNNYDVIYIDFVHSGDFIERNARLVETVIRWVNLKKKLDAITYGFIPQQNIVMGQSMGGLVGRFALREMEMRGENHDTRLFISHDAPQQGANVPIAYQFLDRQGRDIYYNTNIGLLAKIFGPLYSIYNPNRANFILSYNGLRTLYAGSPWATEQPKTLDNIQDGFFNLQDFPAPRQMLYNFITPNYQLNNSMHYVFKTEIERLYGYPTACENVAISNGSECATTQPFLPSQQLLNIHGDLNSTALDVVSSTTGLGFAQGIIFKSFKIGFLGFLPGKNTYHVEFRCYAQPDQLGAPQYFGKIGYTKKFLWSVNINTTITFKTHTAEQTLSYDYVPGGEIQVPQLSTTDLQKYGLTVDASQPSFSFIPTVSSLDIGKGTTPLTITDYLHKYVGSRPPTGLNSSPFTNFITAYTIGDIINNEEHISITDRNGHWLANTIDGTPQTTDCTAGCPDVQISGSSPICSSASQSISVSNLFNSAVAWTSTQSTHVSFNTTSSNPTDVSQTGGSGPVTITATLTPLDNTNNLCGTFTKTKQVTLGSPSGELNFENIGITCDYLGVVTPDKPENTYEWSEDGTNYTSSGSVNHSINDYEAGSGPTEVWVRITNDCGTTVLTGTFNIQHPPPGHACANRPELITADSTTISKITKISIAPNPTENNWVINVPNNMNSMEISLIESSGKQVWNKKFSKSSGKVTVPGNKLPTGIYYLKISTRTSSRTYKLMKAR